MYTTLYCLYYNVTHIFTVITNNMLKCRTHITLTVSTTTAHKIKDAEFYFVVHVATQ